MDYHRALTKAMAMLARDKRALFIGQGVGVAGTTMSSTFDEVPHEQRIEFPVAEDLQMGFCTGLALGGFLPVCVFPRWNFLLCAANQIVNHLDRLPLYSDGGYQPKVIIRVAVPSTDPFNPGPQHDDDFSRAFVEMFRTIKVVYLPFATDICDVYCEAAERNGSTLIVEYTDRYRNARAKETRIAEKVS